MSPTLFHHYWLILASSSCLSLTYHCNRPFSIRFLNFTIPVYVSSGFKINLYPSREQYLCIVPVAFGFTNSTLFQSYSGQHLFLLPASRRLFHTFVIHVDSFVTFCIPSGILLPPKCFFKNLHSFEVYSLFCKVLWVLTNALCSVFTIIVPYRKMIITLKKNLLCFIYSTLVLLPSPALGNQ